MTFPTWPTRTRRPRRPARDQRGAVLPSPVVLLSIVAVALAAVTFVVTRDDAPVERDISATKAAATPSAAPSSSAPAPVPTPTPTPTPTAKPVVRADNTVVVFNNTQIKGLAAKVAATVADAGWKVAGTDNWYGTVPATTVYFPKGKKAAARQLALDLGVARLRPADTGMSSRNITLILTGAL